MRILALLIIPALTFQKMEAQITFYKALGGYYHDWGMSAQQTDDQGYIIAGTTRSFSQEGHEDVYLIKTDEYGDTLWTKVFDTFLLEQGQVVRQTSDGGYVVVVTTRDEINDQLSFIWLIKTDEYGDTLWTKKYDGGYFDYARSLELTNDGGFIIAGGTATGGWGSLSSEVFLLKIDSEGDTLWTKTFGGAYNQGGSSVQQTSDNGYVIVGATDSLSLLTENDVYIVKVDSSGDLLWTKTYGRPGDDIGSSVHQTHDGGYIIAGGTGSVGWKRGDVYLLRLDAFGDTIWTKTFGGIRMDIAYSLLQTTDGGFIIAGETNSFKADSLDADVYLIKVDAAGDSVWTRTLGVRVDVAQSVWQTSDGGFVLTGNTSNLRSPGSIDVLLIKTDSNGIVMISSVENSFSSLNPSVYPNPFNNSAVITFNKHISESKDLAISIFDLTGKKVLMPAVVNKERTEIVVNRGNLPSGLYYFSITDSEEMISTGKLIIQ